MKALNLFLITIFMLQFGGLKAQTPKVWHPVLISMDGTNGYKGVEANYTVGKCNSTDVILLKLTNSNKFAVKAQWVNVVVMKDGKELFGDQKLVSITLQPNSETTGDCSGKDTQLLIKLSDYGIQPSNFETFVGSNFDLVN